MRKFLVILLAVLCVTIGGTTELSINAQSEQGQVPTWFKGVAGYWAEGKISQDDFIKAIQFLVTQKVITLPNEVPSANAQTTGTNQQVQTTQGPAGQQGSQGPKGDKGDTGSQGAPGPQGPTGPQGLVGPAGPIGLQGPVGPQGQAGSQGTAGQQGPPGDRQIVVTVRSVVQPSGQPTETDVPCNPGETLTGGGYMLGGAGYASDSTFSVYASINGPSSDGSKWIVLLNPNTAVYNANPQYTAYAIVQSWFPKTLPLFSF
jgi:hypothetical protein